MQKILLILICMFIGTAHATEMCAKNNTIVVPLDSTVAPERDGSGYNAIEWMWWIQYPYGKLYGISTCLSLEEVQEIENNPKLDAMPQVLNSDDDILVGRSSGGTCYCKIIHPMSSAWVFNLNFGATCTTRCTDICLSYVQLNYGSILTKMFRTVGASMAEKEPEAETE